MAHGDITHFEIPVADKDAATQFYGGLFGWQIAAPEGYEDYPMWSAPNKISGGGLVARDGSFTQPVGYVEVDSIDDVLAKVVAGGGSVLRGKAPISETSAWAVFADPDGNAVGLYESSEHAADG